MPALSNNEPITKVDGGRTVKGGIVLLQQTKKI